MPFPIKAITLLLVGVALGFALCKALESGGSPRSDAFLPDSVYHPDSKSGPPRLRDVIPEIARARKPDPHMMRGVRVYTDSEVSVPMDSSVNITAPTPPLTILSMASELAGHLAVWEANDIAIVDTRNEDVLHWKVSPTLLYLALCEPDAESLPVIEMELDEKKLEALMRELSQWDVRLRECPNKAGDLCYVIGLRTHVMAIRVEVAAFFNRSHYKRKLNE